jgi:hypothetical protein
MNHLWELLVPTQRNDGRPIHLRFHRVWDEKVKAISGGLTILHPTIGYWVNEDTTQKERMIPVRVICSREDFNRILLLTRKYYDQKVITWYKLSSEAGFYDGSSDTLPVCSNEGH